MTYTAASVANHILSLLANGRTIESAKLQALLYATQGWWLCSFQEPLFVENFYAKQLGPTIIELSKQYDGLYSIPKHFYFFNEPDTKNVPLDNNVRNFVNLIVKNYGHQSVGALIEYNTSIGTPWHRVYSNGGVGEKISNDVIHFWFSAERDRVKKTNRIFD